MFAYAARVMGYHVVVLDPDPHSPAARFADAHLCAGYDDQTALLELGKRCAAITTEFENVPTRSLELLATLSTVRPGAVAVAIAQDRITEKSYLAGQGFPVLKYGLAMVLAFIGTKMLIVDFVKIPIAVALGVVALILTTSIILSVWKTRLQ